MKVNPLAGKTAPPADNDLTGWIEARAGSGMGVDPLGPAITLVDERQQHSVEVRIHGAQG